MKRKGGEYKVYVAVRLRPPLQRERGSPLLVSAIDEDCIRLQKTPKLHSDLQFDRVFSPQDSQRTVFSCLSPFLLTSSLLDGYNATCFAYGQTGTGKTYTMLGEGDAFNSEDEKRGIIPQTVEALFRLLSASRARRSAIRKAQRAQESRMRRQARRDAVTTSPVHASGDVAGDDFDDVVGEDDPDEMLDDDIAIIVSYLEIYNEKLYDLLNYGANRKRPLEIREDLDEARRGGSAIKVPGLRCVRVTCLSDVYALLAEGNRNRAVGVTDLNERSSRSHTVFQLLLAQRKSRPIDGMADENMIEVHSKLNLVDLAGSEKWDVFGKRALYTGQRVTELTSINRSLSTLGKCIRLLRKGAQHVPFRESKLTRLLQDSLGGNCKTAFIATVSPSELCFEETVSTLKFAIAAMHVVINPTVNEIVRDEAALLRRTVAKLENVIKEKEKKIGVLENTIAERRTTDEAGASLSSPSPTDGTSGESTPPEVEERISRLRQIEMAQNERQRDLDTYHRWLYALPVTGSSESTSEAGGDSESSLRMEEKLLLMEKSMLRRVKLMEREKRDLSGRIADLQKQLEAKAERIEVGRHVIRMQEEKIRDLEGLNADQTRRMTELKGELKKVRSIPKSRQDDVQIVPKRLVAAEDVSPAGGADDSSDNSRFSIVDVSTHSNEVDSWLSQNEIIFREIKSKIIKGLHSAITLFQSDLVFLLREHIRDSTAAQDSSADRPRGRARRQNDERSILLEEMQEIVEGCTEGLMETVLKKQEEYQSVLFGLVKGRKAFRRIKVARPAIPTSENGVQTISSSANAGADTDADDSADSTLGTFQHVYEAVSLCLQSKSVRQSPEMEKRYEDFVVQKSELRNFESDLYSKTKSIQRCISRLHRTALLFDEKYLPETEFEKLPQNLTESAVSERNPSFSDAIGRFRMDRIRLLDRMKVLNDLLNDFRRRTFLRTVSSPANTPGRRKKRRTGRHEQYEEMILRDEVVRDERPDWVEKARLRSKRMREHAVMRKAEEKRAQNPQAMTLFGGPIQNDGEISPTMPSPPLAGRHARKSKKSRPRHRPKSTSLVSSAVAPFSVAALTSDVDASPSSGSDALTGVHPSIAASSSAKLKRRVMGIAPDAYESVLEAMRTMGAPNRMPSGGTIAPSTGLTPIGRRAVSIAVMQESRKKERVAPTSPPRSSATSVSSSSPAMAILPPPPPVLVVESAVDRRQRQRTELQAISPPPKPRAAPSTMAVVTGPATITKQPLLSNLMTYDSIVSSLRGPIVHEATARPTKPAKKKRRPRLPIIQNSDDDDDEDGDGEYVGRGDDDGGVHNDGLFGVIRSSQSRRPRRSQAQRMPATKMSASTISRNASEPPETMISSKMRIGRDEVILKKKEPPANTQPPPKKSRRRGANAAGVGGHGRAKTHKGMFSRGIFSILGVPGEAGGPNTVNGEAGDTHDDVADEKVVDADESRFRGQRRRKQGPGGRGRGNGVGGRAGRANGGGILRKREMLDMMKARIQDFSNELYN